MTRLPLLFGSNNETAMLTHFERVSPSWPCDDSRTSGGGRVDCCTPETGSILVNWTSRTRVRCKTSASVQ